MSTDRGASASAPDLLTPDDALPPLDARKNFVWSVAGNATYAISQWAVVVVLAQLGTVTDVGRFALGLAITAPIVMFSGLQLRAVYATDAKAEFLFADYLKLRLLTVSVALITVVLIGLVVARTSELFLVVLLVGLAKGLESVSDAFYGVMQKRERMDRLSLSLILRGSLSLVAVALAMAVTDQVLVAAAGYAAAGALVLIGFDVPASRTLLTTELATRGSTPPPAGAVRALAKIALPLGIVMFLISVNVNIPRYFVEGLLDTQALGYFAAIGYLYVGGNMLMIALGESVAPRLSRLYISSRSDYRRLVGRMVLLAAALGVVGIVGASLFGDVVLRALYGPSYAERSDVLVWLMGAAALGFVSSMLSFALTAARSFGVQVPLFATVAAATLVLSWVFIRWFGLQGAGYALFGAAIVQLFLTAIAYSKTAHRTES